MIALGIDVGGSSVKSAVRDGAGWRTATSTRFERPDRDTLRSAVREAALAVGPGPVGAVGLCVPGVRAPDGSSITRSNNLPGLVGYRFDQLIEDALGVRVPRRVLTDAGAATLDAAHDHPTVRRVLGIALGTGVGAAIVEQGHTIDTPHLGRLDLGPIAGAHPSDPGGRPGTPEAYLGTPALRARLGDDLERALAVIPDDDPAIDALVRTIRSGLTTESPDLVVLLGGVGLALGHRLDAIDARVRAGWDAPTDWRLGVGTDTHHAARGAARAAERHARR